MLEGIQMRYRPGLQLALKSVTVQIEVRLLCFFSFSLGVGVATLPYV